MSVTYSFTDGTVASADEVNQNFDDIIAEFDTSTGHDHDGTDSKQITLTTGVTGTLPATNGGTAQSTYTQGDILYSSAANTLSKLGQSTKGKALTTGGSGANPSWEGMTTQGDIEYHNGTNRTRLAAGTSGLFLQTKGSGSDPVWGTVKTYFEPDSTCIIAFDNGSLAFDLSNLRNVPTLTSLAEADLVDGKVSAKCYDYKGTEADYVTIAHHALQAGMSALTIEAWVYRDTAGFTDCIVCTDDDLYMSLTMGDANFSFVVKTSVGDETATVAHDLSNNGIDQWVHVVAAWDSSTASDIFVNGVDKGDGSGGTGTVNDSTKGIHIGNWGDESQPFHGKIDGVRVLRRKMAVAEALLRYNAFA